MATFILKVVGKHPLYIDGNIVYPGNQIELDDKWRNNAVVKAMIKNGDAIIIEKKDESPGDEKADSSDGKATKKSKATSE